MKVSALAGVLATALGSVADARVVHRPVEPAAAHDRDDFWSEVIEPHAAQIRMLLHRAREDFGNAEHADRGDADPLGTRRLISIRDAYDVLRYAHRLSPQNVDVLAMLARAADELGNTREAIDACTAYLTLVDPNTTDGEVAGRLGTLYLRLGQLDDAVRYLRLGTRPPETPTSAYVAVALATALSARGQMTEAIDTLLAAQPDSSGVYFKDGPYVAFALAVMYDRDDQRSAAFEILDHLMKSTQSGQATTTPGALREYAAAIQQGLDNIELARPEDEPYYDALLYESAGLYAEARTEWATYAAIPDAPWRARALEHIAALDEQRRTAPPPATTRPPATGSYQLVPGRYRP